MAPVKIVLPVFQVLGLVAFMAFEGVYMAFLVSLGDAVAICMCPAANATLWRPVNALEGGGAICNNGCVVHKDLQYSRPRVLQEHEVRGPVPAIHVVLDEPVYRGDLTAHRDESAIRHLLFRMQDSAGPQDIC